MHNGLWPVIGRFLKPDPLREADQLSLYAYVGNDPGNKTDPTGLARVCTTEGGVTTCVNVDIGGDNPENIKPEDGGRFLRLLKYLTSCSPLGLYVKFSQPCADATLPIFKNKQVDDAIEDITKDASKDINKHNYTYNVWNNRNQDDDIEIIATAAKTEVQEKGWTKIVTWRGGHAVKYNKATSTVKQTIKIMRDGQRPIHVRYN